MTDACLPALLDTLLPGDGRDWPAAGQHGLAAKTRQIAALAPLGTEALDTVLAALPPDFACASPQARERMVRQIETTHPRSAFDEVVKAAYSAYYTDPAVRDVIARLTGYENRPPQPLGYHLPDFDESLLERVRSRGPIWRTVPEE